MATQHKTRQPLNAEDISQFADDFRSDPRNRLVRNAVTQRDVDEVALDRDIVTGATHTFSTLLDDWSPTHQGASGRCWLFSGLNLFRVDTMKKLDVGQFEFSQSYMMFWDKIERANFVLEAVIETADRPIDDRVVQHLMQAPVEDAGQWDMFINLVDKYGVAPKSAMPETESSANTRQMNSMLYYQVRQGAVRIRSLYKQEAGLHTMRQAKLDTLKTVYRILCIHLGSPPSTIDWQWRDRDGEFHRDGDLTPIEFSERYLVTDYADIVCLVNDPRPDHPYFQTYTIGYLGNAIMLYEIESVRRFVGVRLSGPLPDETTILNFRHLLDTHDLGEGLFEEINGHRRLPFGALPERPHPGNEGHHRPAATGWTSGLDGMRHGKTEPP